MAGSDYRTTSDYRNFSWPRPERFNFAGTWWAAGQRIGTVITPVASQFSAQDIAYRVNAAKATCIIRMA